MKKALLLLGMIAAGAASGGVVAWSILSPAEKNGTHVVTPQSGAVSDDPFSQAGTHFTSYQAEQYPDLTYAAENAVKAVVNIEVVQEIEVPERQYDPFFEFFGIPQQGRRGPSTQERRGGGSGVIISADGYIVTNNHVVDEATRLRVKLSDGRTFDAKVIGTDPTTDVALVKIEAEDLPYNLQSTITAGIVSAKARQLDVIPSEFRIESFIQTDAAVNPGNSGGALVNTRGELVGINTVIKTMTGSYVGYSFAVPETIVRKVVVDLKEYGVVQRALLGLAFRPIDQNFIDQMGEETGIEELGGVYVASVSEGGAASQAGIRKGDVILSVDGVELNEAATLQEQIGKHRPNDKVKLMIKRSGSMKQIEVTLRNKAGKTELLTRDDVDVMEVLGGKFATADERLCRRLEIRGGVEVLAIKANGILSKARVRPGFVITHINDKSVRSLSDMQRMTDKVRSIDGVYPDGRSASYVLVE